MDLPSLARNTAPWKLTCLQHLKLMGRVVHLQWQRAYGLCMGRGGIHMSNRWPMSLFRRTSGFLGKEQTHRDISVSWHFLKHQYCNAVHWLALLNLLYNLEDLAATCLTIIREQTTFHIYIRIWKPKEPSMICCHFKRFKIDPYSLGGP